MAATNWLLLGLAALSILALVAAVYRGRETPVRGRTSLILLRSAVLVVLLLLLWDPELRLGRTSLGRGDDWVLLDASLSMAAAAGETTAWERGVEAARSFAAEGARLYLASSGLDLLPVDSLVVARPVGLESRVVPWLTRAAEAGARAVTVVSDMRFSDGDGLAGALSELPFPVRFEPVNVGVRNAAVAAVTAPRSVAADSSFVLTIELSTEGLDPDADTVLVELSEGGSVISRAAARPAPLGVPVRATIRAPAPRRSGTLRYDVHASVSGDGLADDDVRSTYVTVSARAGEIVLVSFQPDWEPRFLLPVLEASTGLSALGYLRVGSAYVMLGSSADAAGRRTPETEIRVAAADAELLVLHGLSQASPDWALAAAREHPRTLIFPTDPASVQALGHSGRPAAPGEWYIARQLPASALAAALAGLPVDALPPLTDLIVVDSDSDLTSALLAQRARRGRTDGALLIESTGSRRRILAVGRGYWRWSFRPGEGREAYRRVWSAAAGWLLESEAVAGRLVRPEPRVVPRDATTRWVVAEDLDTLRLRILAGGTVVQDTVLLVGAADTVSSGRLAPGHYRYAVMGGGPAATALAEGPLTVERFSADLTLLPIPVPSGREGEGSALRRVGSAGRRLHTHPAPYLLALVLLCAEWLLRRRWGLR